MIAKLLTRNLRNRINVAPVIECDGGSYTVYPRPRHQRLSLCRFLHTAAGLSNGKRNGLLLHHR